MGAVDLNFFCCILFSLSSHFRKLSVEIVYSPWDGARSVCSARLMGRLSSIRECIFALKKKRFSVMLWWYRWPKLCGFPRSSSTVAGLVIEESGLQMAWREVLITFIKAIAVVGEEKKLFKQGKKACVTWQFVYSACTSYSSEIPTFPVILASLEGGPKLHWQTPSSRSASFQWTFVTVVEIELQASFSENLTSLIHVYMVRMWKISITGKNMPFRRLRAEKAREITWAGKGGSVLLGLFFWMRFN